MSDLVNLLIEFVARLWYIDSEMREQSPSTAGSQFDRDSRRAVAWLCGGIITVLLIVSILVWRSR